MIENIREVSIGNAEKVLSKVLLLIIIISIDFAYTSCESAENSVLCVIVLNRKSTNSHLK